MIGWGAQGWGWRDGPEQNKKKTELVIVQVKRRWRRVHLV